MYIKCLHVYDNGYIMFVINCFVLLLKIVRNKKVHFLEFQRKAIKKYSHLRVLVLQRYKKSLFRISM